MFIVGGAFMATSSVVFRGAAVLIEVGFNTEHTEHTEHVNPRGHASGPGARFLDVVAC
jgi:hypothetical protein